jgi:DNA-binding beta-propeller fold protein YncE
VRRLLRLALAVSLGLSLAAPALARLDDATVAAKSRITARIDVPGSPFNVDVGEGFVWVLDHPPTGCNRGRPCTVSRIDAASNRVVGKPTPLPAHAWDIEAGGGAVWVTQFDGRLIRIDPRTARISARISARPLYFGSVVTFGGGFVWTGNDDERNEEGSVSKIDPATNGVVGTVGGLGSPQSIGYGAGAVWVADHLGWLVKIDPRRLEVVARTRLRFGPHGVVATERAVYVADAHAGRLLVAHPRTAKIRRVVRLPVGVIHPALGAGSLWSGSARPWNNHRVEDDRVVRIAEGSLATETLHVGGNVPNVAFGFGSVWAGVASGEVVRISP